MQANAFARSTVSLPRHCLPDQILGGRHQTTTKQGYLASSFSVPFMAMHQLDYRKNRPLNRLRAMRMVKQPEPVITRPLFRSTVQSILILFCIGFCGCSTTYFHAATPSNQSAPAHLPYSSTQHDGLITLFRADSSIELESTCGQNGWQTIKTETSLVDMIVRAIANPVWGTQTIKYQCKENAFAHIDAPNHLPSPHYQ